MKKILFVSLLLVMTACNNEKPTPETNKIDSIIPLEVIQLQKSNVQEVTKPMNRTMSVRYHVKEGRVYVELFIPNFTFSNSQKGKKDGEGYLILTIDGEKKKKINSAAFIIDGLSEGKHVIQLELYHHDHTRYHLKKQFTIDI